MIKLLLVEDDKNLSYIVQSGLQDIIGGYEVITACNGEEGLEAWKAHRPDIIISDIDMPVMDGYEATREIRKLSLDVPIIAVTAFAYASDEQRAMENGFDGYMAKPISAPQLRQQIAAILQKRIILL